MRSCRYRTALMTLNTLLTVFSTIQEKRKIPPVPNGVTDLGDGHGGHGGPELQRTGK